MLYAAETLLTCLQFVEYDQRNHRLHTLASFSFWVSSTYSVYHGDRNHVLTVYRCLAVSQPA